MFSKEGFQAKTKWKKVVKKCSPNNSIVKLWNFPGSQLNKIITIMISRTFNLNYFWFIRHFTRLLTSEIHAEQYWSTIHGIYFK